MATASAQLVEHLNGAVTPVDTPAVAAAKASHFAAKAAYGYAPYAAGVYNGAYGYAPYAANYYNGAYGYAPYAANFYNGAYYNGAYAYAGAYGYPLAGNLPLVQHANGAVTPVDTPSVAAAKADHFAAKGFPAYPGYAAYGLPYAGYAAYAPNFAYAGLKAYPNGAVVPVEPADVVKAREEHLALF